MKLLAALLTTLAVLAQGERNHPKMQPNYLHVPTNENVPTPSLPLSSRIVGGKKAKPHSFPHQAGIFADINLCGASIISEYWLLTAAHCVHNVTSVDVSVGSHRIMEYEESQQRFLTSEIIVHENFSFSEPKNDIALLHLSEPIQFGKTAKPIALQVDNSSLDYEIALLSGWGKISDDTEGISESLRYLVGQVIPNEICRYYFQVPVLDTHICLSGEGPVGSCNGDSGGPLIIMEGTIPIQVGIVSFGSKRGCETGYPTVYTRISEFTDWIQKYVEITTFP